MPRNDLIQLRSDTAANWASVNPTLAIGEQGFETDTGKLKVGTGSTAWNSLLYVTDASDLAGVIPSARISGSYTGITGVGALTAGTWNASVVAGQYGGTGVNNSGKTITLGGNLTTSGAFTTTLTATANTSVTLPISGTLATTDASSLASGTLNNLRLPAAATNITSVGTLSSMTTSGGVFINNGSPTIYLQDTDSRSSMIHCNSNLFYVLRGSGTNSTTFTAYNGQWPLVLNLENNAATLGGDVTAIGALNAYSISGNSNVAGTGNASYHPSGVYSTGTNWLYGTVLTNGSDIGSSSQYVGAVYSNNFFRSSGTTGWYSETYGGGIHMVDTTWVRTYNAKGIYTGAGQFHNARTSGWGATYDSGAGYFYAGSGPVNLGFYHVTGTNIILNQSDTTFYFRNSNNSQYVGVAAIIYNQSSRELKQDIVNFPQKLKSVGSAVNPLLEESALDIVEKLQPRFYRWDYEKTFGDELPREERRRKALSRLNKIRKEKGIEPFMSDETLHKCGRDCDAPDGEVCNRVKDWKNGSIGFVAEEVGEVIPQAARYDMDGKYTSVDSVALNAICVAAIKELKERLEKLEESNV